MWQIFVGDIEGKFAEKQGICLLFFLLFFAASSSSWMDLERKCVLWFIVKSFTKKSWHENGLIANALMRQSSQIGISYKYYGVTSAWTAV
jgi:hypothetical protein